VKHWQIWAAISGLGVGLLGFGVAAGVLLSRAQPSAAHSATLTPPPTSTPVARVNITQGTASVSSTPNPSQALDTLLHMYGSNYSFAGPVTTSIGTLAAVSHASGDVQASAVVEIFKLNADGVSWTDLATLGEIGGQVAPSSVGGTPVFTAHLTPGSVPDFVVVLNGAPSAPLGLTQIAVASNITGSTWELDAFDIAGSTDLNQGAPCGSPRVAGNAIVCAATVGGDPATTWTYQSTDQVQLGGWFVPS
jgi:hypothetical protein